MLRSLISAFLLTLAGAAILLALVGCRLHPLTAPATSVAPAQPAAGSASPLSPAGATSVIRGEVPKQCA